MFRKPIDQTDFFEFSKIFGTNSNFGRRIFQFLARKFPVKLSKLLPTGSGSTLGWKTTFFEKIFLVWLPNFEWNCFWLSAKNQQIGCQNFSLRVQETKWRNRFFTKVFVFTYIRTSSEIFFNFWKFLFANLWKLLFTSSDKVFDAKITLWWTPISFCRVVIRIVSDFRQKCTERLSKAISTCSEDILKKQIFPKIFFVFGTY